MYQSMTFSLTIKQIKIVNKWRKDLIKNNPEIFQNGIYPNISYIFTPTGIGDALEIYESHTKTKLDITDYESW